MGSDTHALDAGRPYRFQLRLTLGTVAPAAPATSVRELEATVRHAAEQLARRAELAADVLGRLGERGWLPLNSAPAGREVLAGHGFAGPDGAVLPEAVSVARDALPAEVARDLADVLGEPTAELVQTLTVLVDDLDLPVVLTAESAELRYSPREYLDTFSVRI
jgi:hypothetical protein